VIQRHIHGKRAVRSLRSSSLASALALSAAAWLVGCAVHPRIGAGREYPGEKERGASANIQVARHVTELAFTNTSARPLPPGAIWANSAYSREFPGLAVGESITLSLSEFKDRFGEPFRAGGFFATERPSALVRIQIETGSDLIGLTVIGGTLE